MIQLENSAAPRARIALLDELRGFAVLCMVVRHAFFLIGYMFDYPWAQRAFDFFEPVSPFFAGTFVVISGICAQLSRSNLRRGAKLMAVALGLTLVTWLVVPEELIRFGVLHMLASCMLIYGAVRRAFDRVPAGWGLLGCAVLFVLTAGLFFSARPYIGVPGVPQLQLTMLGRWGRWLFPLGVRDAGFTSADYYPIFPWLFAFLAGTVWGRRAAAGRFAAWTYPNRVPAFSFLGRHALLIFVLHQPVLYGIMLLLRALGIA